MREWFSSSWAVMKCVEENVVDRVIRKLSNGGKETGC